MALNDFLRNFNNATLTIKDNRALNLTPATQQEQDSVSRFVDRSGTGSDTDRFKRAIGVYPFTYKETENGKTQTKPGMIYVTKMNTLNGGQPKILGVETADASYTADGGMDFLNKLRELEIQSIGTYDTKTGKENLNIPIDIDENSTVLKEFTNAIKKMRTKKKAQELKPAQQMQKLPTPDELKGTPIQQMPQRQQVPEPTPANSNPAGKWIWEYLARLNNSKKA